MPTGPRDGKFPDCEPCCLDNLIINFEADNPTSSLVELAIFIRLWRALQRSCAGGYSLAQLADICTVLGPLSGGVLTAEFIRQLAALQMLREHFGLQLTGLGAAPTATGGDRTQLLALWVGNSAGKWNWAIGQLLEHVAHFAGDHHKAQRRPPEFIKILLDNFDPLSRLAGFDPDVKTDTWHARPTCTLRFAEILSKIYASDFSVGDMLFLLTAEHHLDGDDVFPLQDTNDALDEPLGLAEHQHEFSLQALRRKLLKVEATDEICASWNWGRIVTSLQQDFGYAHNPSAGPDPLLNLGKHFFPGVLESSGISVSVQDRRFYYANPVTTPPLMWNVPADGPFQCDTGSGQAQVRMWTQVPLRDEAVIAKLNHVRSLGGDEQAAVQDLYLQPRLALAPFAFLFPDFSATDRHLIQEPDEQKRWTWFVRRFALTYARCGVIAEHLTQHVGHVSGQHRGKQKPDAAWLILRDLFGDENEAAPPATWQDPTGAPPPTIWGSRPNGSSFAALLGLTGTGLLGEISASGGPVLYREMCGPLVAFGAARNAFNAPVPTLIPAMSTTLPNDQSHLVSLHNGFASRDDDGSDIGGAQGFSARWSGVLLIERDGRYEFQVGSTEADGHQRHGEDDDHHPRGWCVVLKRGQRSFLVLNSRWPEQDGEPASSLSLKQGAYQIIVEFRQPASDFSKPDQLYRRRTGFQINYRGPDSGDCWSPLPLDRLFIEKKDGTLWRGIGSDKAAAPSLQPFSRHCMSARCATSAGPINAPSRPCS
jgi:hypothetical protein